MSKKKVKNTPNSRRRFILQSFGFAGVAFIKSPTLDLLSLLGSEKAEAQTANMAFWKRTPSIKFCAVGTNIAAITSDASSFQTSTPTGNFRAVAWNGSVFCALGTGTQAATSPDGITWTARTMPVSASVWEAICWNGSVFCAVGQTLAVAAISSDGITWTTHALPNSGIWTSVSWNGSAFIAIQRNSETAATSTDGITWTSFTLPIVGTSSGDYKTVVSNGAIFLAVSSGASVARSTDGVSWTSVQALSGTWNAAAWNGAVFCVIGNGTAAIDRRAHV